MKIYNKYIVLAAMALTFAACTQEDDFTPQTDSDAVKINATIGKLQTRVAYEDNGTTNFINGDQIRVVNTMRTSKNSATYNFDGTTWTTTDAFVWNGSTTNQFKAWYPATASFDSFDLPTDQSAGIEAADWMTAETEEMTKPRSGVLDLNFVHKLTKVTVTVSFNSQYPAGNNYVSKFRFFTNEETPVEVTPFESNDGYTAILLPGVYAEEASFITLEMNFEDNLTVPVNSTLIAGLEAGKHYNFHLTVGKDAVGISYVRVLDWDEEEIDGGVAEEDFSTIDATAMNTNALKAAVTRALVAGETSITITLAADAPVEMITAIRRALRDTEGVADGSINLTLKGVTAIPDHSDNVQDKVLELNSINLPDVVTIGKKAFYGCENLAFVTAPKVQTIGEIAFAATALTSVEFPELTTIPNAIFNATYSLSSAKFPKVTTIESHGLLIGALFTPEAFLLELTAEGDITFNGESHFNVSSQNYSDKVDLVLHANKQSEVTFNDDGTATWKGYTFKSITFACTDGTTNHSYTYTDNGDGTHNAVCSVCDNLKTEDHTIVDGKCECGVMEIAVDTVSITPWAAVASGDDQRLWEQGDSFTLHLFNQDDPTKTEVHTVTYDGEKWNMPISSILPAYFIAYIGDGVTVTSPTEYSVKAFEMSEDQSDADKLKAADVLIATGTVSGDAALDLLFEHHYAKVTFNVELAFEFNSETDVISRFDVVTCDGDYVKPYIDGNSYTALVPANPYFKAGVHFALVTINGKRLEVLIPAEYAAPNGYLDAGTHYTFNVVITAGGAYIVCNDGCSFEYSDNGDGTHDEVCSKCAYVKVDNEKHTAVPDGYDCICGATVIAVIDGTLGGKSVATDEDINALVEQLKAYVDNGITTIIVTGENPAIIDMGYYTNTAIGEAIYRLSGSDYYDENNPYNGKIDLILQDVTEIVDQEFYSAWVLNSITLPKVIKMGDEAFHGTWLLKTITFGSVLTEANEADGVMFAQVGKKVGGCDLILNCGQMNESSVPAPDLTANTWKFKFANEFKSITLTHTGECDECKANQ